MEIHVQLQLCHMSVQSHPKFFCKIGNKILMKLIKKLLLDNLRRRRKLSSKI